MSSFARPRPITAEDDWSSFDCGEPTLSKWLRERAMSNERGGASRTFISVDRDSELVAGYYCLSASSLRHEDSVGTLRKNMPDPIPIVLLGRLAVDNRFKGEGLGASLLADAVAKSLEVSATVGARAVLVHALNESAQTFYDKFGFTLMPNSDRAMYLLMQDALATLATL